MPRVKFKIPQYIQKDDTFSLCDSAWSIIFPEYWCQYRSKGSFKNASKIKILSVEITDNKMEYLVGLMEVAPQEGRLVIPVGIHQIVDEHKIHLALALSHKIRLR